MCLYLSYTDEWIVAVTPAETVPVHTVSLIRSLV